MRPLLGFGVLVAVSVLVFWGFGAHSAAGRPLSYDEMVQTTGGIGDGCRCHDDIPDYCTGTSDNCTWKICSAKENSQGQVGVLLQCSDPNWYVNEGTGITYHLCVAGTPMDRYCYWPWDEETQDWVWQACQRIYACKSSALITGYKCTSYPYNPACSVADPAWNCRQCIKGDEIDTVDVVDESCPPE